MVVSTSLGYLGSYFLKKKIQKSHIAKSISRWFSLSAYQFRSYVKKKNKKELF